MLNEETHDKLNAMKLFGLAAAFHAYLEQSRGPDELSFDERFCSRPPIIDPFGHQ